MKKQMKAQKILMLCSLITGALVFVYALCFLTGDIANAFYYIEDGIDYVNIQGFVNYSQSLVKILIALSITLICTVALMYIMACNSRRKYYTTNYVAIGIFVLFALAVAIYIFVAVTKCMNIYRNEVYWDEGLGAEFTRVVTDADGIPHTVNGHYNYHDVAQFFAKYPLNQNQLANFILGYVAAALVIVDAVLVVLCTVWKSLLMKGEQKLLQGGSVKAEGGTGSDGEQVVASAESAQSVPASEEA